MRGLGQEGLFQEAPLNELLRGTTRWSLEILTSAGRLGFKALSFEPDRSCNEQL